MYLPTSTTKGPDGSQSAPAGKVIIETSSMELAGIVTSHGVLPVTDLGSAFVLNPENLEQWLDWKCGSDGACRIANAVNWGQVSHVIEQFAIMQATNLGASLAAEAVIGAVAARVGAAADAVDIAGARFAQKSFSETFSKGGLFAGRSIDEVAEALKSGAMSSKDVPINVVVREGNTLITNTRSAQALTRAGIPRDAWNVINRTGDPLFEKLLTGQLTRNGLTSAGTVLP
jgi:hypothetical protein